MKIQADTITKKMQLKEVREEIMRRLQARGYKIIPKTSKKFWAVKRMTKQEINDIVTEITRLLEIVDIDGGVIRPALKWSYALLNETNSGAAGISIEI